MSYRQSKISNKYYGQLNENKSELFKQSENQFNDENHEFVYLDTTKAWSQLKKHDEIDSFIDPELNKFTHLKLDSLFEYRSQSDTSLPSHGIPYIVENNKVILKLTYINLYLSRLFFLNIKKIDFK